MLIDYDFNRYRFFGLDNEYHTVKGCPVDRLVDLQDWLTLLNRLIKESDIEKYPDFASLYLNSIQGRSLCNEILQLNGINPSWLNIEMVIAFLHHTTNEKGDILPSLIARINKLDKPVSDTAPKASIEECVTNLLLDLINTGLAKDLKDAEQILSSMPAQELEALLLNQFNRLKSPEQRKKEKEDLEMEEAKARFEKDWGKRNFQPK